MQGNDAEQTVYFSPKLREGDDELKINEAMGKLKRGRYDIDVELINDSRGDLALKKNEVVGSIHSVSAAIPMCAGDKSPNQPVGVNVVNVDGDTEP